MSPILMRPVREQLEHDRVIRLLQAKWRRRYQVGINVGSEQTAFAGSSSSPVYPDLVLCSNEGGRRVEGVVEVETAESVNNMEALAEWVPFGKLRASFYLYIPNGSVDNARRLISDNNINVSEIWSYYLVGDQMRFTLVHKAPAPKAAVAASTSPRRAQPRTRTLVGHRKTAARRPAKTTAARKRQRPTKKASRTPARAQKRK